MAFRVEGFRAMQGLSISEIIASAFWVAVKPPQLDLAYLMEEGSRDVVSRTTIDLFGYIDCYHD